MAADETYLKNQIRLDVGDIGKSASHEIIFPVEANDGAWDFTLSGATASAIDYPNAAATVQASLEALVPIGGGNVLVSLGARGFLLEYQGDLANQDVPLPTINGSSLLPAEVATASVPVLEKSKGQRNHWTDSRLTEMWARRSGFADMELRFLYVKIDAIEELRGIVWTQINEQTGDQKREYEKQFAHLEAMLGSVADQIEGLLTGKESDGFAARGSSVVGQPKVRDEIRAQFQEMRYGCPVWPR